jgi:hypothetical protein
MNFRVYSGPKGSADVSPIEKSQLLFKEFATLDDALSWARHLEGTGRMPLLIEGDDGTRMNRRAIADALGVASNSTGRREGSLSCWLTGSTPHGRGLSGGSSCC